MERTILLEHLTTARLSIERAQMLVARQKQVIAVLAAAGEDTGVDERILQTLEETQSGHLAEMQRILNALDAMPMAGMMS